MPRHHQADGQRLAGQGHPIQADTLGKRAHPLGRVVGHDGQADARRPHLVQPGLHGGFQHLAVIPSQRIIHIQHQRRNAVRFQIVRVDALNFPKYDSRS